MDKWRNVREGLTSFQKFAKFKVMTKYIQKLRKDLIIYAWSKYKSTIKMSDVADIFGMKLNTVFQILKRASMTSLQEKKKKKKLLGIFK